MIGYWFRRLKPVIGQLFSRRPFTEYMVGASDLSDLIRYKPVTIRNTVAEYTPTPA